MPLPPDLQRLADDVTKADAEADAIVYGLSDEQFHWQPDGGRAWSIAQCLDHLATANAVYSEALAPGIERAQERGWSRHQPLALSFGGRWFVNSLEPPVTRRMRAPSKIVPRSAGGRDEILRRYHAAHERVRQLIDAAAQIDVNRATFKNPFIPLLYMKIATGLSVISAHDRRHLWQARNVAASQGLTTGAASR